MSEKHDVKSINRNARMTGLESWLDDVVNRQQPLQMPASARQWIADNAWWITLIGGIVSLLAAWNYWQLGQMFNGANRLAEEVTRLYGSTTYAAELGPMWYLALLGLVVQGGLLLLAVSKLKEHKKSGWDLLFYASLASLVIGLLYLVIPGYGFGGLLGSVVGAAVSWFFLFQVRSRFNR
jgi:hypothetical protein